MDETNSLPPRRSPQLRLSKSPCTSSHQHDEDDDDDDDDDDDIETSRVSTPYPTTYINSLHPLDYQNYQIPSSSEQTDETLFVRQTTLLNQTQQMHEEMREGFKSFGKALKGVFRKKKNTSIDDEEELKEDEFVYTPDDYVPNDDETRDVDNEEYNRINEEIYDDVNVKFKYAELADERKGDKEMIDAEKVNVEHKEANQEVASAQVQDEAQVTTTAAPATQKEKTDVPPSSSSRSVTSNYGSIFLNLDNISSVETEIISMLDVQVQHENPTHATTIPPPIPLFIPHSQQSTPILTSKTTEAKTSTHVVIESKTLSAIHIRVSDLEKEVKGLRNVNHSTSLLATIKFEVPTAIKEYLGTNLGVALQKVIQRHTVELILEYFVLADVIVQKIPPSQKEQIWERPRS
ncbi:hypothetical protein Tco_1284032 [Tanacetum coccineum]